MRKAAVLLILFVVLIAFAVIAEAQQLAKLPPIGLLFTNESSQPSPNVEAVRQGLRALRVRRQLNH
jgi:hypothetical protein